MITTHECWWTRNFQSELTCDGDTVAGAGCPREVLEHAATLLGTDLRGRPSAEDEHGEELSLGAVATGSGHDGCFFALGPSSAPLKLAVVASVLELHAGYLRRQVDWSGVLDGLAARLTPGVSLRMRSRPGRQRLTVQCYSRTAGVLRRFVAPRLVVDCRAPRAVLS